MPDFLLPSLGGGKHPHGFSSWRSAISTPADVR